MAVEFLSFSLLNLNPPQKLLITLIETLNTTKIETIQVCIPFLVLIFPRKSWFLSCHSSFFWDYTAVSLLTWVFPTVPYADGTDSGGLKSCWIVEVGGHFERVHGAVYENSGARSLLVEKSYRNSSQTFCPISEPCKCVSFSSLKTLLPQIIVVGK